MQRDLLLGPATVGFKNGQLMTISNGSISMGSIYNSNTILSLIGLLLK